MLSYISLYSITGSSSEADVNFALRQMAVYIANLFYLTSDALVPIVRDKDLTKESLQNTNIIVLGAMDSFILRYLQKSQLRYENDTIRLGKIF